MSRAHGREWRAHIARLRPELEARAGGLCELCGRELDFEAPARSPSSPSVDHVVPIHAGGARLPPVEELRLVHYGCNSRRGNRTRARPGSIVRAAAPVVELEPELAPTPLDLAPVPRRRRGRPRKSDYIVEGQVSLFERATEELVDARFSRTAL